MNYLKTLNNLLPVKSTIKNGYIFIYAQHITTYNTKKLIKLCKKYDVQSKLYIELTDDNSMYIIDLKLKEGVLQFYRLQLQKELKLYNEILDIKKNTNKILKLAKLKIKGIVCS